MKACQEALDDCCPHQGDDQLELQEEEEEEEKGVSQVNDEKNGRRENCEEEVKEDIGLITKIESSERNGVNGFERNI